MAMITSPPFFCASTGPEEISATQAARAQVRSLSFMGTFSSIGSLPSVWGLFPVQVGRIGIDNIARNQPVGGS
jgi:hypothetical protein